MNDDEWMNEKKRFSDFAETLHNKRTYKVKFLIFGVWRKTLLGVRYLDFCVEISGFSDFFSEFRQI